MKNFGLTLLAVAALSMGVVEAQVPKVTTQVAFADHGGGNGGDDLELELKKKALQISYFVKSDMGSKIFKMLNPDNLVDITNTTDIDVVTGNVVDKYGTLRTCVNEPERSLITCNLSRINELKVNRKDDILTAMLFHELLGVMQVELGYQENVSMYPISSKIIAYNDIVSSTPISEAQIRPEFYGLDSRSYGITFVNKETKETLRMICINNNVEIHRCRNYSIVRSVNGIQSPVVDRVSIISKDTINAYDLRKPTLEDLTRFQGEINRLNSSGFKYASLGSSMNYTWGNRTREVHVYGTGLTQKMHNGCGDENCGLAAFYTVLPIAYPMWALDTAIEGGKQAINIITWPVKAIVNGFKLGGKKKQLKKLSDRIDLMKDLINKDGDLSFVGKTRTLSEEKYQQLITDTKVLLQGTN